MSSTATAASPNVLKRTSLGRRDSKVSESMNSTSIGSVPLERVYICPNITERGISSAPKKMAAKTHLEEGQKAIQFLLEGSTLEA